MIRYSMNVLIRKATSCQCFVTVRSMAGHSKWANIKHIKAQKDGQRAAIFQRLAQQMRVAIQEGKSANPSTNFQLNQAIEVAKRQNMPVEKIQNILKAAQSNKNEQGKSGLLEIRGPGGCWILVSIHSDNINRTKNLLQPFIRKASASVSEGGAKHNFHHKGIILANHKDKSTTLETCLDHAIEAGAEDVTWNEEEKIFNFTCAPGDLHSVRQKLQNIGYDIQEATSSYIPHIFAELNEQQLQVVSVLCDKIQEHPDVVILYDNIA